MSTRFTDASSVRCASALVRRTHRARSATRARLASASEGERPMPGKASRPCACVPPAPARLRKSRPTSGVPLSRLLYENDVTVNPARRATVSLRSAYSLASSSATASTVRRIPGSPSKPGNASPPGPGASPPGKTGCRWSVGNAASARLTHVRAAAATVGASGAAAATVGSSGARVSASRHVALDARSNWTSSVEDASDWTTASTSIGRRSPRARPRPWSSSSGFTRLLLASIVPA